MIEEDETKPKSQFNYSRNITFDNLNDIEDDSNISRNSIIRGI